MEGKLMELLCLQIEQMTAPVTAPPKGFPGLADREHMNQVRQLIEENISAPLSIEELARKAGMNRTKLQQNFKKKRRVCLNSRNPS